MGQAAGALNDVVKRRLAGKSAAFAEARGRAVHDGGVDSRGGGIAKAQPLHRLDADVVHQHVALRYQLAQLRLALLALEIQTDRTLVAVDVHEGGTHARGAAHAVGPHQVAFGRLDLDDFRAVIGQHLGGHRPQHHGREIQHLDAGERPTVERLALVRCVCRVRVVHVVCLASHR
ncbi:hypothetical protein D3C85_1414780 [compost metagenome]